MAVRVRPRPAAPRFRVFVASRVRWSRWLRTVTGLRADEYYTDVTSDLAGNSGTRNAALLSPKLAVRLGPWKDPEVYLNYGYGFHSNDARGATLRIDPTTGEPAGRATPLVRAKGLDLGLRTAAVQHLQAAVTVFPLDLDSELVFSGDGGTTEASRPSRRQGIELQNFYRPRPWLALDADYAVTRARFTDIAPAGDRIPGAIEKALSAGISVDGLAPWFGGLRLRYFGPRPLVEDDGVRSSSSSLLNLRLGRRFANGLSLTAEAFNVLDGKASDIDYLYESRLPGETEPHETLQGIALGDRDVEAADAITVAELVDA